MKMLAGAAVVSLVSAAAAADLPGMPGLAPWADPIEHAFTVKVPQSWKVTGGTHRIAPIDARNYVRAESPDGKIKVWIDDPNILPRQVPHPAYYRLGWYEGRVVQAQTGPLLIKNFETGARFAQEFAAQNVCSAPRLLSTFDLEGETQRMNQEVAPVAARAHVRAMPSAGEAVFHCGDRFGYIYAVTVLAMSTPQGPRSWAVYKLAGYLSEKAEVATARYVMNAMRASFTMDRGWEARYERQVNDTTGALMELSNRITQESIQRAQQSLQQNIAQVERRQKEFNQMNQRSMSSFQRQQASLDRIRQRQSDVTLGQIHGCDDLGNCATVSNDYDYYWTKDGRTIVGGPSDGKPPNHDPQYRKWTPDY